MVQARQTRKTSLFGQKIHEGFIDDHLPVGAAQSHDLGSAQHASIRIVGIDHHRNVKAVQIRQALHVGHVRSRVRPCPSVPTVGRPKNADAPRGHQGGQPLDERLRSWHGHHARRHINPIGPRGHPFQVPGFTRIRQSLEQAGRKFGHWPAMRIDPG